MGVRKLRASEKRPDLYKTFIVLSDEKPVERDTTSSEPIHNESTDEKLREAFVEVPISACEGGNEDFFEAYKMAAAKYSRIRQSLFSLIMAVVFFLAFFILFIAILVSPKGIIFKDNCVPVNYTDEFFTSCQHYWNISNSQNAGVKDNCRALEYLQSCMTVSVAMATKGSCSFQDIIQMTLKMNSALTSALNMTSKNCR